jgi:protease-4
MKPRPAALNNRPPIAGMLGLCVLVCGCLPDPMRVFTTGRINADLAGRIDADAKVDANVDANLSLTPKPLPVQKRRLPHAAKHRGPVIALVDVDGVLLDSDSAGLGSLGENPVASFREKLDAIEADSGVCAVVLRINTYGGSVTATDVMWRDLLAFRRRTRLPVVACLMDVATGGGYYLATAADKIVAHPTTITGGIGCILNLYNLQDLMGQFNIVNMAIKSGPKIDLGTPTRPLDEENRLLLQQMCDEFHARFRKLVVESRPVDAQNEQLFDGRVFTGSQAVKLGLVDAVGYLDDALAIGRRLGKSPAADVVSYRRKGDEALSTYAITPNVPLHDKLVPVNIPGLDRTRLPTYLYMWLVEPSTEKLPGK